MNGEATKVEEENSLMAYFPRDSRSLANWLSQRSSSYPSGVVPPHDHHEETSSSLTRASQLGASTSPVFRSLPTLARVGRTTRSSFWVNSNTSSAHQLNPSRASEAANNQRLLEIMEASLRVIDGVLEEDEELGLSSMVVPADDEPELG